MSGSVEYACGFADGREGRPRKSAGHLIRPGDYAAGYQAGTAFRGR